MTCPSLTKSKLIPCCQHSLLNLPNGALQFGQVWMTSLHVSMQNGIRQQPNQHLKTTVEEETKVRKSAYRKLKSSIYLFKWSNFINKNPLLKMAFSPLKSERLKILTSGK